MKLPNAESALVDLRKLHDYCLNPDHHRGKDKAQAFEAALGLTTEHAEDLREAILSAVLENEARPAGDNRFGALYSVDFEMMRSGKRATARSCWIILIGEGRPRLTSCFIRRKRADPDGISNPTP